MIRQIGRFRKTVMDHYREHGRSLPWRDTRDPYAILVSEVMLQQTQVDRVREKYAAWMELFPDFRTLAEAPLKKVLGLWKGLGYNRRALNLKKAAQEIVEKHDGRLPRDTASLLALPGIGPATAGDLQAFAWDMPVVVIETNIRSVFIHHFFADHAEKVHDKDILPLIEATLDKKDPRTWYYALMDYGSHLKKTAGNAGRRSRHYAKQTTFKGSFRKLRAEILFMIEEKARSGKEVEKLAKDPRTGEAIAQLHKEGFIISKTVKQGQKRVQKWYIA